MAKRKRRIFTSEFKARVVLEALRGESSQAELCRCHNLSEDQVSRWKRQLLENAASLFGSRDKSSKETYEPDPNGGCAYIKATYIGKEIGTYRRHAPSSNDPFGRAHRKLLNKLQDEGRVEPLWSESGKKRIGWRLTETEWNRLTLDE